MPQGHKSFRIIIKENSNGSWNLKACQRYTKIIKVLQKIRYENSLTTIRVKAIKT